MTYNTCGHCGACDGRAGLLIRLASEPVSMCRNCHETKKTGNLVMHGELSRTHEEITKTMELVSPLERIRSVIARYHVALDNREHGGVAQDKAIHEIENILDLHWGQ